MERNPYSPPQAAVADVDEGRRRERPVPVAVILLLYVGNALVRGLQVIDNSRLPIGLSAAEIRIYQATGFHALPLFFLVAFSH
jgi:hypothetical protein